MDKDIVSEADTETNGPWITPIIRGENGNPVGVSIFLTDVDLEDLGLELENQSRVYYDIREEGLQITDNLNEPP